MARHGTLYRIFFPRNSYDASLSLAGALLWLTVLAILRSALIWGGGTVTAVIVGAAIGILLAAFEIGIIIQKPSTFLSLLFLRSRIDFTLARTKFSIKWLRLKFKFPRAFIKFWSWCHVILPAVYGLLDLGFILALVVPPAVPATTLVGLLITLRAFATGCETLSWIHFTWTTATIRSKQIVLDAKKNPDEPDDFKPIVPPSDPAPRQVEPDATPNPQPAAAAPAPVAQNNSGWSRASRPESFSQAQ